MNDRAKECWEGLLSLADSMKLFGKPLKDATRDELIVGLVLLNQSFDTEKRLHKKTRRTTDAMSKRLFH